MSKTESDPTIVVVIPYYNGSEFIERAVKSVLNQTVPANEFIVVNDGSSDAERDFLHALAEKYEFKVLDKENGGQGSARNAGVAASTSDFICFLDQDDFYLKTHIQILIKGIPEDDPHFGWVYGDLFEAEGNGDIIRTAMVKAHSIHPKTEIIHLLRHDMHVLPSASLISREAFESVGGFDHQFMGYEDDDLFLRIFRKGYTNIFIDKPVTVWCIHTGSTSYSIRMSRSRFRYFKKLVAAFPDDPAKNRFYLRDLLIPRFHGQFVHEAIDAIRKRRTFDEAGMAGKSELIDIFHEYAGIISRSESVPFFLKHRVVIQSKLIASKSLFAISLAKWIIELWRYIRRRLRI